MKKFILIIFLSLGIVDSSASEKNAIKKNLKEISYFSFNFKVNISKQKYIRMIRERYISCLLNMSNNEIKFGISEIKSKYKNQIKFTDTLKCISYRK